MIKVLYLPLTPGNKTLAFYVSVLLVAAAYQSMNYKREFEVIIKSRHSLAQVDS